MSMRNLPINLYLYIFFNFMIYFLFFLFLLSIPFLKLCILTPSVLIHFFLDHAVQKVTILHLLVA